MHSEAGEDRDEPDQPPAASQEFSVSTKLAVSAEAPTDEVETEPAAGSELADVELAWVASTGKAQSVILRNVPLEHTLAEFRLCCSSALGVDSVKPHDFNEDMDCMSLHSLGIGTSALPFFVEASPPPPERPLLTESAKDSTEGSRRAAGGTATCDRGSLKRPLAERQAFKDASEIKDGWLFLGGNLSASSLVALRELGITHVLNCCERVPCRFKKSLTYKVIQVFDTKHSDISKHFHEALEFIDAAHAAGGGVLVHCMVGASRSTSLVLAWLVARCQMPLLEAFRHVRAQRSVARPNRAFCHQLIEFEKEVLGKQSASLADFGHA